LKARGFLISNFYDTEHPSFRVGCIGAISPADMGLAVEAMGQVLSDMNIQQRQAA
jgi:2-aminoethylphosphonate-pyruvate transaminase